MQPDCTTPPLKTCTKCGRDYPATSDFFYAQPGTKSGQSLRCKSCVQAVERIYRAANKAKKTERWHRWYAANRDVRLAAARDSSSVREYQRSYRESHAKEAAEYGRVWRAENREKVATYARNHEALRQGNGGTHTTEDILAQYARQKGRCFYCDAKVGKRYHVDHVTPLVKKGSNGPENLVIACPTCNLSKGAKHPMEFAGRLL